MNATASRRAKRDRPSSVGARWRDRQSSDGHAVNVALSGARHGPTTETLQRAVRNRRDGAGQACCARTHVDELVRAVRGARDATRTTYRNRTARGTWMPYSSSAESFRNRAVGSPKYLRVDGAREPCGCRVVPQNRRNARDVIAYALSKPREVDLASVRFDVRIARLRVDVVRGGHHWTLRQAAARPREARNERLSPPGSLVTPCPDQADSSATRGGSIYPAWVENRRTMFCFRSRTRYGGRLPVGAWLQLRWLSASLSALSRAVRQLSRPATRPRRVPTSPIQVTAAVRHSAPTGLSLGPLGRERVPITEAKRGSAHVNAARQTTRAHATFSFACARSRGLL